MEGCTKCHLNPYEINCIGQWCKRFCMLLAVFLSYYEIRSWRFADLVEEGTPSFAICKKNDHERGSRFLAILLL